MAETFADELTPILSDGDLVAAWELLHSLEGQELRAAKDWFAGNRRWLGRISENLTFAGDDHEERFDARHRAAWIVGLCAIRLCGPATAAGRVPWNDCWDFMQNEGEAAFVQLLWDTDRAWVADFVEAASHIGLGGNARNTNGQLSRALRAAAVHHALPCPTGRTFLACWTAGTGRHATLADRLAADPFMPDLLFLYLASGHCGDMRDLPEATAELCARGVVERATVLEAVLEHLTTVQRPVSQQVLAETTAALDLKPTEIPGGLTYILGVLATSYKTVVPILLPHALDLIEDAEGLHQLTTVLAARPEKRPKETLLAALKQPSMQASVGLEAVLTALDVLGSGDDAAFSDKLARTAASLAPAKVEKLPAGASVSPSDEAQGPGAAVLGLWNLPPAPVGVEAVGWWARSTGWNDVLDSRAAYRSRLQPRLVDLTLAAMADGTFGDGRDLRRAADGLLGIQRLSMSALGSVFDDLFLGGGLRQAWPTALAIADAACAAPRRPAGLAGLLRTLGRYTAEVPRPGQVPPHLAALAAGEGRTKAQMEARLLVAGLVDEPVETALVRLRDNESARLETASAAPQPARRGLWKSAPDSPGVLPSYRRLADPVDPVLEAAADLSRLRAVLSENFNGYAQNFDDVSYRPSGYSQHAESSGLTYPERVLAATVEAINRHGADAVRTALAGIDRYYGPLDVVVAIDTWAAGTLDSAALWRVLHGSVPLQVLRDVWQSQGIGPAEVHDRARALPPFSTRLAEPDHPDVQALVLPFELTAPVERLAFVRAAEVLLRAEWRPSTSRPMLCTPTWADCTLDFDDLLPRLRQAASNADATVGPVDLVQALHRLRPVDPARAVEVPDGLRTDVLFAEHGERSWDATDLVRTWIARGGLPDLEPRPDENGRWSTSTVAPVPFTRLAALPPELADDPWTPGPIMPSLRLMPRWGDRVVEDAFASWGLFDPRHFPGLVAGPFGVPLHDRLLALMTPEYNTRVIQAVPVLVEFARQGRLVPAAVAAAAVGRHEAGTLRLGILTKGLQRGFEEGGFRQLWPSVLAIADGLCGVDKKPGGLADLLRLLTTYAHEVPAAAVDLPPGLLRFAENRGSTKSHVEARELVAALRRAAQA